MRPAFSTARIPASSIDREGTPPLRLTTPLAPADPAAALGPFDANPNLSMALAFVWDGIPVFPIWSVRGDGSCGCASRGCGSPGKHPIGSLVPRGFKDATCDLLQIVAWWDIDPTPNVGIPTGHASGCVVLDVDPGNGGSETLERLVEIYGPLPMTWTVDTGGSGTHHYMRHPGVPIPNSAGKIGPGLDIRGDGGYVVTPPSRHGSGLCYAWAAAGQADSVDLAECPAWLMELVGADTEPKGVTSLSRSPTADPILEGRRNDSLARIAGAMRRQECSEETIFAALREENERRCQPPLPEGEVLRIARSIASYPASSPGLTRRPSTARGYTPFTFRNGTVELP
jgi:hypothetical protein